MKRPRKISPMLMGLAYIGFVSLGLPDGLNGVAWPSIRTTFGLPVEALGALLVMFTAGYLLSSFISGWLLSRIGVGTLLALSCFATAAGLIGYALSFSWLMIVGLGAVSGLGAGAIDAGLNTFAATQFSPRAVNWLHACYGVGAAAGPAIMTSVLASNREWRLGYGIVGVAQLLLAFVFVLTRKRWPASSKITSRTDLSTSTVRVSNLDTLRLPAVWLSIAVFFVYTGIEAAAGIWAFSLFTEARAVPMMTAGMWVSVYWGALTVGRLVSGFVAGFIPARRMLQLCIAGIAVGAGLIWLDAGTFSLMGLGLLGLCAAPVFPTLISATPSRIGIAHTGNAVGFQIAAAVLGQSLLPALFGLLAAKLGLEVIGPSLLTAGMVLALLYLLLGAIQPDSSVRESHSNSTDSFENVEAGQTT